MMRDDQRDETDRARARRADSVSKNSFQNQRDNHRAPADEDRGRIKIRDRRTFLEIHPRKKSEAVNREREQEQIKRRAIQSSAPPEPRRAREQERENVEGHALAERLQTIEQKLEGCSFRRIRLFFGETNKIGR